jgi:hypothetical protein
MVILLNEKYTLQAYIHFTRNTIARVSISKYYVGIILLNVANCLARCKAGGLYLGPFSTFKSIKHLVAIRTYFIKVTLKLIKIKKTYFYHFKTIYYLKSIWKIPCFKTKGSLRQAKNQCIKPINIELALGDGDQL